MAKLLVLGAGIYQVPLLETIRAMGHESVACSIPGNYPGFAVADRAAYVDTTDQQAVLELAKQQQVAGILTTGTDVAVRSIGYVCEKLGLPGVSYQAACNVTDKFEMRKAMQKGGVRCPGFAQVRTVEQALEAAEKIGWPVIFKCVDRSGSRGITRVENKEQVNDAFRYAFDETRKDYILVEKFLEGPEIGVDGYISPEGDFLMPHEKLVYHNGAACVPLGHMLPFDYPETVKQDVLEQVSLCARAVGLERAFVNLDILLTEEGAYVLEIGARGGATCIPELITEHTGVNYYEQMVHCALGEPVDFSQARRGQACVARLMGAPRSGVLARVEVPASKPEDLVQLKLDYGPGDAVRPFRVGPDRIGHLLVKGADLAAVRARAEELCGQIHLYYQDAPEIPVAVQ